MIKLLNNRFDNCSDALKYVKSNKRTIIQAKKSEIKIAGDGLGFYTNKNENIKEFGVNNSNYIYPVISTTNYLDSHQDVHLWNSMNKTAAEQNNKVYYLADHKLEVNNIIAQPKDVEVSVQEIKWSELGRNYEGKTQALIFKINKNDLIHEKFKESLQRNIPLQNSIRMQYIKLGLGINDREEKEEFAYWQKHYESIVNKETVDQLGYFFGVEELKIIMEGSAVLFGSNDTTPIKEAVFDTSNEPLYDTQKKELLNRLIILTKI